MRALLHRPDDGIGERIGRATVLAEDLGDQQFVEILRDPEAVSVLVAAGDRARAMRPVTVRVAVTLAGEVALRDLQVAERLVRSVDAGVQHGDLDALAGAGARKRADGLDAPGHVAVRRPVARGVGHRLQEAHRQDGYDLAPTIALLRGLGGRHLLDVGLRRQRSGPRPRWRRGPHRGASGPSARSRALCSAELSYTDPLRLRASRPVAEVEDVTRDSPDVTRTPRGQDARHPKSGGSR